MDSKTVVRSLAALAHELRLDIFRLLVSAGSDGMTPTDLLSALDVPTATISFHLKELSHAGMVTQERQGRNVIYRASFEHAAEVLRYLVESCCQAGDAGAGSRLRRTGS